MAYPNHPHTMLQKRENFKRFFENHEVDLLGIYWMIGPKYKMRPPLSYKKFFKNRKQCLKGVGIVVNLLIHVRTRYA